MSRFLQINSLLNDSDERQSAAPGNDGAGSRSEPASRPMSSSSTLPRGPVRPVPGPVSPQNAQTGNTHAVREQPIYTMNDYRYWPYTRHATPLHSPHPAPAAGSPYSPYSPSPIPQPGDPYPDPRHGLMPWHRQRRTRACQNCHVKKVKCEGDGARCLNCMRANIECKWIPMKKRGPKPKVRSGGSSLPVSRNSSAVHLPQINEQPERGTGNSIEAASRSRLGIGIGHGAFSGSATHAYNSRAASVTAATVSPYIADRDQFAASQHAYRSVSSTHYGRAVSIPPPPAPPPAQPQPPTRADIFYRIVADSQGGEMTADATAETLRRFYSDEVSEETRNAVIYYFEYFYGICPIFHPALFVRRIVNGEVDQILIDAMRASAARIINRHTGSNIDLDHLIEDTDAQLLSFLENPTVDYVRAVVVMASLNGGECRFVMYNTLTCLASSLVNRLGWHMMDLRSTSPDISWREWISIEIKRRTFYVVFQIDAYLALVSDRSMTVSMSRSLVLAPGSGVWWDNMVDPCITDKLPTRINHNMTHKDVIKAGSTTHNFVAMTSMSVILEQVNNMLWDFKLGLPTYPHGEDFKPNIKFFKGYVPDNTSAKLPIRSLFDIEEFRRAHETLTAWRCSLVNARNMKSAADANSSFDKFGSYGHRVYQMRIRYFCLYTYSVPIMHCLHFANRPSYFETQSANKVFVDSPDVASHMQTDAPENRAIYDILANVFTDRLNRGMLAYDVINDSWRICVDVVHDLVRHLDQNKDIPLERYDQVMPFCLMTSMTVLIRNARICKHKIETGADDVDSVRDDLAQSTASLRRLWTLLGDLNNIWRVEGVEYLMRIMQVEEVVNAADLLSGLSL